MDHPCERRIPNLLRYPAQMFGLLRVCPVNRPAVFLLFRCIPNPTFKSNSNSMHASGFHPLTERFRNTPPIIGNNNHARGRQRRRDAWTSFDFDLPPSRPRDDGATGGDRCHCRLLGWLWAFIDRWFSTLHFDNVRREVIQCWMVRQDKVLVDRQGEVVSDFRHDFGLFDRVNAQFSFEVLVHFDEICGIARVFYHNLNQDGFDVWPVSSGDGWCIRRCGGRLNGDWRMNDRLNLALAGGGRVQGCTSLHSLNVPDHVIEGGVICQNKILVDGEVEPVPDVRHDFGLLDRVNAEFPLEVLVEFNEICGVPCMLDHHGNHGFGHGSVIHRFSGCRCWRRSRRRGFIAWCGWCGRGWGRLGSRPSSRHLLDVSNHVIEGWIISENEIFVDGEIEAISDLRHDFSLLNRINAELALKVLVQFDEVGGIPGVVDNDLNNRGHHSIVLNGNRRGRLHLRGGRCNDRRWFGGRW